MASRIMGRRLERMARSVPQIHVWVNLVPLIAGCLHDDAQSTASVTASPGEPADIKDDPLSTASGCPPIDDDVAIGGHELWDFGQLQNPFDKKPCHGPVKGLFFSRRKTRGDAVSRHQGYPGAGSSKPFWALFQQNTGCRNHSAGLPYPPRQQTGNSNWETIISLIPDSCEGKGRPEVLEITGTPPGHAEGMAPDGGGKGLPDRLHHGGVKGHFHVQQCKSMPQSSEFPPHG